MDVEQEARVEAARRAAHKSKPKMGWMFEVTLENQVTLSRW